MPVVPQAATMENQEGMFVYLLDNENIPRITYIKTMGQVDNNWVVSDGVKAGDRILTTGLQKVIPGNPVRIVETAVDNSSKPNKTGFFTKIKRFIKKILGK